MIVIKNIISMLVLQNVVKCKPFSIVYISPLFLNSHAFLHSWISFNPSVSNQDFSVILKCFFSYLMLG